MQGVSPTWSPPANTEAATAMLDAKGWCQSQSRRTRTNRRLRSPSGSDQGPQVSDLEKTGGVKIRDGSEKVFFLPITRAYTRKVLREDGHRWPSAKILANVRSEEPDVERDRRNSPRARRCRVHVAVTDPERPKGALKAESPLPASVAAVVAYGVAIVKGKPLPTVYTKAKKVHLLGGALWERGPGAVEGRGLTAAAENSEHRSVVSGDDRGPRSRSRSPLWFRQIVATSRTRPPQRYRVSEPTHPPKRQFRTRSSEHRDDPVDLARTP